MRGVIRIIPPTPGCCLTCYGHHGEREPHNRDSLWYQITFFAEHARYPSWRDAAAHCPEDVRERFLAEKKAEGLE